MCQWYLFEMFLFMNRMNPFGFARSQYGVLNTLYLDGWSPSHIHWTNKYNIIFAFTCEKLQNTEVLEEIHHFKEVNKLCILTSSFVFKERGSLQLILDWNSKSIFLHLNAVNIICFANVVKISHIQRHCTIQWRLWNIYSACERAKGKTILFTVAVIVMFGAWCAPRIELIFKINDDRLIIALLLVVMIKRLSHVMNWITFSCD